MSTESRLVTPGALYGTCFALGWVCHDLVYMAFTREPYLMVALLPGSVAAVALSAGIGALSGIGLRFYGAVLLLAGAAVVAKPLIQSWGGPNYSAILTPLFAGLVLAGVGFWAARRWKVFPPRLALASGAALAALRALQKGDINPAVEPRWGSALVLVGAGTLLLVGLSRSRRSARTLSAVTVLLVVAVSIVQAQTNLRLPAGPASLSAEDPEASSAPNVVLITLDTVRADHLGPYGHHRATTPVLDEWVERNAVVYEQARSASSWTLPSHGSLFTGRYPGQHGATNYSLDDEDVNPVGRFPARPLPADVPTLAELLLGRGYATAAIAGNSAYLNRWFGLDRGFIHYDDRFPAHLPPRLTLAQMLGFRREVGRKYYRMGETITDLALDWLDRDRDGRPFFLFLNYNDAHKPNVPPEPYAGAFEERRPFDPLKYDASWLPLQYDRELLYLDRQLGDFLQGLEERVSLDETLIVITSDHGELFGEHGLSGHNKVLYEEVVRVPLYVKPLVPSAEGRGHEGLSTPISGPEVYWMILRELGLAGPGDGPTGLPEVSLIGDWYYSDELVDHNRAGGSDAWLERDLVAWLDGGLKVIVGSDGGVEAYDLGADAGESENIATEELAEYARHLAAEWWSTVRSGGPDPR